jgi:hypothetical protein
LGSTSVRKRILITIASWNSCRSRWKLDAYGVGRWAYEDATDIYFFSATIGVDHTSDARVSDTPRSGRANKSFQLRDMSSCGGCPHSLDSPLRFTPGAPCEPPRANRDLPRNCPKKRSPATYRERRGVPWQALQRSKWNCSARVSFAPSRLRAPRRRR